MALIYGAIGFTLWLFIMGDDDNAAVGGKLEIDLSDCDRPTEPSLFVCTSCSTISIADPKSNFKFHSPL